MRTIGSLIVLSVVFVGFGVLAAFWAFVTLERGDLLTAAIAGAAGVFGFSMVVFVERLITKRCCARVTFDDEATTLRPDRRIDLSLMTATVAMYCAMVLYSIFSPLGMVNIPVPTHDERYLVGIAIAGVLVGLPTLRQMIVKRVMSYVRLRIDGFDIGNSFSSVSRSWSDVAEVSDRPPGKARPVLNTGTTYVTTTDGRTRVIASDWYTPDGRAFRRLFHFYWEHADRRGELIDGRAIQRLEGDSHGG